tara:strand:+ start:1376 stop:1552 length:177 start_codon:yes stop_codon:yes gene_type:complete
MLNVLVDTMVNDFTPGPDTTIYTVVDDEGYQVMQTNDSCEAYSYVAEINDIKRTLRDC